jgi:lipopolysaccharide/colanic/teichoic acid biosynthesis glycosyltransferase
MRVPSPTSRSGKRVYLSAVDLVWALSSPVVALYLRDPDILSRPDWTGIGYYWLFSSAFALIAFAALRLQDGMTRYFSVHEALDVAEAVLFAELMTFAALFTVTRLEGIPRSMPLTHGLLLGGGLIAARLVMRILGGHASEPIDYRSRHDRIIIIGANRLTTAYIHLLRAYAPQQQPITAILDENPGMVGRAIAGVQIMGMPQELEALINEFAIHGVGTDRVVVAGEVDFLSEPVMQEVERICKKRQVRLSFLPRMIGVTEWNPAANTDRPAHLPAPLGLQTAAPMSRPYFRVKRAFDVLGSLLAIVVLSPLMLVAGVLVLADVGPPVLFWQERLGWRGRSFLIYKFRTLGAPFDSSGNLIVAGRRPTVVGRFLRATRIDELPQLLNVLLGDMSLIGPRPLLPEDQPNDTSLRLSVRPGITGWAQINGAKLVSKEEKEELDAWYVEHASLWVDLMITLRTLQLMMTSRLSSREAAADAEQVEKKRSALGSAVTTPTSMAVGERH